MKSLLLSAQSPRRSLLAAGLAAACGLVCTSATALEIHAVGHPPGAGFALDHMMPAYLRVAAAKAKARTPRQIDAGMIHHVTSCLDDGSTGTLRAVIGDAGTVSGDTVDFAGLSCSTITLDASHNPKYIPINQDDLYITGPGAELLSIDGGNQTNIFQHFGGGILHIAGLTIENGRYESTAFPFGGCVYSQASVDLQDSVVSHCVVRSDSNSIAALGGAIFTTKNLTLVGSKISDSYAFALGGTEAYGGGASVVGYLTAKDTTVGDNWVGAAAGSGKGHNGGLSIVGGAYISNSTISGNFADYNAGLGAYGGATIVDSTISDNTATSQFGGIFVDGNIDIRNSTIAFNKSISAGLFGDGLHSNFGTIELNSSIIADNTNAIGASDLGGSQAATGANDLITSSTLSVPFGTLTDCPRLDILADNGGPTKTHALQPTSPALDKGDPGTATTDQRGVPRVYPAGGIADIGAFERQDTDRNERILSSGFDGLCDQ